MSKIPSISPDRIDRSAGNSSIGTTKEDLAAHAFVKGKDPIQPLTVRLPMPLYNELRELAFNKKTKIAHIIIKLIRDHIREEKTNYTAK